MKVLKLVCAVAGLVMVMGCTSVVPPVGQAYAPVAPGPNAATIAGGTTPASAPPPAVSALDSAVEGVVHNALENDPSLKNAAHDISVSCHKGTVTLMGRVPTAHDREAVVSRVSKLPCVDAVNDELAVNFTALR